MSRSALFRLASFCVAVVLAGTVRAEDWPNWRGPTNNGISRETGLATEWSPTKNVAWNLKLPGAAAATPVVWDDRIFLTSVDGESLVLMCISTEGKELWRREVGRGNKTARNDEGNTANPSPSTDGKYVWAFMGTGDLGCYDFDGNEIWKFNLQDRYGKFQIQYGMSSTPAVHGDALYQQLIHGEGDPKTREAIAFALDKRTGEQLWKVGRPSEGYAENEHSYASPVVYDDGRLQFLITHGADYTVAHSLKDGKELWRCGDLNLSSSYDPTLRFVASPSWAPGIVVIPTAKRGPVVAVRPDAKGLITRNSPAQLWRTQKTPDVPSPLIEGDYVYLCMQDGNLQCLDRKTGKEIYFERTERDRHRASPVYADGKVYLSARNGKVTVVKAGPKFEVLAVNDLGESLSASPAISNGTIYLRTFDRLWAIRGK